MKFEDALRAQDPSQLERVDAPDWIRKPASVQPLKSVEQFSVRADDYFTECVDSDVRPTITGLCLALGLPGPTTLIRLGQRVPVLRPVISRCMTAISHQYEQMIGSGQAAGPMFMLKNIPDFDPEEADGAPAVQFFNDRKEVLLQAEVVGAAHQGEAFDGDEDPLDVYLSIIKRPGAVKTSALTTRRESSPVRPRLFRIIEQEEDGE